MDVVLFTVSIISCTCSSESFLNSILKKRCIDNSVEKF